MTATTELGLAPLTRFTDTYTDETRTYSVTPDAIRARVAAAAQLMELAQTVSDAETIRYSVAVALADMAVRGDDLRIVTAEYAKTVDVLTEARAAHTHAVDQLTTVRLVAPISA